MKYISIILLIFCLAPTYGQVLKPYDSLAMVTKTRLDSLRHFSVDSINMLNKTLRQIDTSKALLSYKLDSISILKVRDQKIDSLKQAARHKLDSIKLLELPHEQYLIKVDSLNKNLENQVSALNRKADLQVREWKSKLSEKLSADSLGLGIARLPDAVSLPVEMDLPDMDQRLSLPQPRALQGLDDLEIASPVRNPLENNQTLDQLRSETDKVVVIPKKEIEEVKGRGELDHITGELGQVRELSTQIEEYNQAFTMAKDGNVEDLENKVQAEMLKRSEIDYLGEEVAKAEALKAQHTRLLKDAEQYQDQEMIMQRIKEKSKRLAVSHLPNKADYRSKLEAAQNRLAAYKKKYGELRNLQDTLLKKTNPLKGKPLKVRLRPGLNLEIIRSGDGFVDVAPFLGYRLNDRWFVYVSYLYRFTLEWDDIASTEAPVYGFRACTTFDVYKGFSVIAAVDHLSTIVPRSSAGEHQRQWVPGWYGGIGKWYNFSRHLKGTMQLLYNLNHHENSPFPGKLNVRMGFQFDLSKKPKKAVINFRKDDIEKIRSGY